MKNRCACSQFHTWHPGIDGLVWDRGSVSTHAVPGTMVPCPDGPSIPGWRVGVTDPSKLCTNEGRP